MNETWWLNPNQLDEHQKEILQEKPETQLLVAGPPGSGKTNILMLRANYVRGVLPRIHFLTFTRTLCEFLRSGPNIGRGDQIKHDEISTFMSWARGIISQNGRKIEANGFEAARIEAASLLQAIVDENRMENFFDVIFVDEVQDFLEVELRLIRRLAKRINAAGDSRQRIWRHREGLPTITTMVTKTVTLEQHYRIGARICDYADRILPPKSGEPTLAEGCNYDEVARPSSVVPIPSVDLESQFEECIEQIRQQRRYIIDEPIGVLAITGEIRDRFWALLEADAELGSISIRQRSEEYQAFGPNSAVRVMTIASAKGSEFRAVHLLEAEAFSHNQRELAFTAVTRAKTEVTLHHTKPLRGFMTPKKDGLPSINEIF